MVVLMLIGSACLAASIPTLLVCFGRPNTGVSFTRYSNNNRLGGSCAS